ncbi:TRAP transporter large permease subunit [Palleronia rufa]
MTRSCDFAATSWARRATTWGALALPVYPPRAALCLAAVLLLIRGVADVPKIALDRQQDADAGPGGGSIAPVMFGLPVPGPMTVHPLALVPGETAVPGAFMAGKPTVLGIVLNRTFGDVLDDDARTAIPFFVLMAQVLSNSGVTDEMFESLRMLMSNVRGGLALAVVSISILLAATIGIIGASITVTGVMALRPMLQRGYSPTLTNGVIAASGCRGALIPPWIVLNPLAPVPRCRSESFLRKR